jgi:hypothetical protein
MDMEGPSDVVFVGQVKAEPRYTIPAAQRSQAAAIMAEAQAALAQPVDERAAPSDLIHGAAALCAAVLAASGQEDCRLSLSEQCRHRCG